MSKKEKKKKKKYRDKKSTLNIETLTIKESIKKEIAKNGLKRKSSIFTSR